MRKLMLLTAMAAGMAFLGTADTAQAGHSSCRSGYGFTTQSYGYRTYSPRYYSSPWGSYRHGGYSQYRGSSFGRSVYGSSHRGHNHGGIHIRTRGFSFGLHR